MAEAVPQLISYIAPSAPATRRPATGNEPFLRPEIGFTPKWYRDALGIDFGERWHTDPSYRRDTIVAMRSELRRRFDGAPIGGIDRDNGPLDLLTGTYGACTVAGIFGLPIRYHADNWPVAVTGTLTEDQLDRLEPPDLDANPFLHALMDQVEWIARSEGVVRGYINWQGILNNAHRLRGEDLFLDMLAEPERCRRLFDCVCATMIDAAKRLHERQRVTGFHVDFFTASNCLVNLVSPELYRDLLLPYDKRIAEAFDRIGIHNCAWTVDLYAESYASVPRVAYIDMGLESNLTRIRELFPTARRAVMYRPTELAAKSRSQIEQDLQRVASQLGPCDLVAADIESGTPDERVLDVVSICDRISGSIR
ncbi:MAG: hypothetical protein AMXMBFR4_18460 [Candidatus Hydrogenedentota bacterium]